MGFPTETQGEFQETCALIKQVKFNGAYIFKYSVRPGTVAANIAEESKPDEKEKRHRKILDLQRNISRQLKDKHQDAKN